MTDLLHEASLTMARDMADQQERYFQGVLRYMGLTAEEFDARYEVELHPVQFTTNEDSGTTVKASQALSIRSRLADYEVVQ